MKTFSRLAPLVLLSALSMVACGDDTSGGSGGSTTQSTGGSGGSGGTTQSTGGSGGATSSGGSGGTTTGTSSAGGQGGTGGNACPSITGQFDADGCLSYDSASAVCGFNSDGSICDFSVSCGSSEDASQCSINCEMGSTVNCYKQPDVDCLVQAACDMVCADLTACGWIL